MRRTEYFVERESNTHDAAVESAGRVLDVDVGRRSNVVLGSQAVVRGRSSTGRRIA